jgi:hypothetical protein
LTFGRRGPPKIKYLVKANDEGISHCRCEHSLAGGPIQLDCPWCGCGWMIACMTCHRAFTYARVVEIEGDYAALAERDLTSRGYQVDADDICQAADWFAAAMAPLSLGEVVVHLDGNYFPLDTAPVHFSGDFAEHRLDRLPHALERTHPGQLDAILGDKAYWIERERPDRD